MELQVTRLLSNRVSEMPSFQYVLSTVTRFIWCRVLYKIDFLNIESCLSPSPHFRIHARVWLYLCWKPSLSGLWKRKPMRWTKFANSSAIFLVIIASSPGVLLLWSPSSLVWYIFPDRYIFTYITTYNWIDLHNYL